MTRKVNGGLCRSSSLITHHSSLLAQRDDQQLEGEARVADAAFPAFDAGVGLGEAGEGAAEAGPGEGAGVFGQLAGSPWLPLDPDEHAAFLREGGEDRVRSSYGEEKYARLVALKDSHDHL